MPCQAHDGTHRFTWCYWVILLTNYCSYIRFGIYRWPCSLIFYPWGSHTSSDTRGNYRVISLILECGFASTLYFFITYFVCLVYHAYPALLWSLLVRRHLHVCLSLSGWNYNLHYLYLTAWLLFFTLFAEIGFCQYHFNCNLCPYEEDYCPRSSTRSVLDTGDFCLF